MEFVNINCAIPTTLKKIERVGLAYFNAKNTSTNSEIERSDSADKLTGEEFQVDINYLKSLDPKEWKNQDHYAVLGLATLR